ncbi:hypothetical protein LEM8419_03282 [Neolewinella maritima]|uniref:Lipocalin-like domain-containing protein n=1 Tax=Neolewinella maritima TaxID=1383882 RepID=A0ABN8F8M8_9BACT|nr:hypothetical protein [Neolewinella maritima]CAH1002378.1 hypothetical protein LEM8419_03282 [Neolewinella maritima]
MSRLLPILLLGLLVFSGCPRDEPEDDFLITSDLYGTWAVDRFDSEFTTTGTFLGEDVDQSGSSQISSSALEMTLRQDGSWSSTGDYDLSITTEDGTEVTQQQGIGQGSWTFSQDTLYLDGLQNYNGVGNFSLAQPLVVTDFERDLRTDLSTQTDETEEDVDFGTELRVRSDWDIRIVR